MKVKGCGMSWHLVRVIVGTAQEAQVLEVQKPPWSRYVNDITSGLRPQVTLEVNDRRFIVGRSFCRKKTQNRRHRMGERETNR